MADILVTPEAERDLINIWLYIARDNPKAAECALQAAEETFNVLATMPPVGALYQSRRTQLNGVRFFPVSKFQNYIIYYREHRQGIEIIRVLHGHMDRK